MRKVKIQLTQPHHDADGNVLETFRADDQGGDNFPRDHGGAR